MPVNTTYITANLAANTALMLSMDDQQISRKSHCLSYTKDFDAKNATVESMQEYAACVDTLYPKISEMDYQLLSAIIILFFVVGTICAIIEWLKFKDFFFSVLAFIGGLSFSALVVFVLCIFTWAIGNLF